MPSLYTIYNKNGLLRAIFIVDTYSSESLGHYIGIELPIT